MICKIHGWNGVPIGDHNFEPHTKDGEKGGERNFLMPNTFCKNLVLTNDSMATYKHIR